MLLHPQLLNKTKETSQDISINNRTERQQDNMAIFFGFFIIDMHFVHKNVYRAVSEIHDKNLKTDTLNISALR